MSIAEMKRRSPDKAMRDEDLAAEVKSLMEAESLSQSRVCQLTGINSSRLSQWLADKYAGDNRPIEADLRRWLDSRRAQAELTTQLPEAPAWCETPSARAVLAALTFAQMSGSIACIYGGAGLGKTTAIRRYQAGAPNVWVVTATPAAARPGPILTRISKTLGLRTASAAYVLESNIIERVRETRGLLVIDEAQHLCHRALDCIRSIHDAAGVGVALAGNEIVYSQMTGGNRAIGFAQLFSRIGKRVRLERPKQADIDTLIDAWGIDSRESRDYCRAIGRRPGALRGLTQTLRIATLFAAGKGEALSLTHIKAAWADLGGDA